MAKAKEIMRNKTNTATTKAITSTSTSVTNGKVRKVRVSNKNMKISLKTSEETTKTTSIENKDQAKPTKTRLCFVKLRRALNNDISNLQNNNKNNNHTLQAQCKINEDNQNVNKNTMLKEQSSISNEIKNNNDQCIKMFDGGRKKLLKSNAEDISKNSDKIANKVDDFKSSTEQSKEIISLSKSTSNKIGLRAKSKVNTVVPLTPKKCVIKLQKTPRKLKSNNIIVKPTTPYNTKEKPSPDKRTTDAPSTPTLTKRCIIKLQKIPNVAKDKHKGEPKTPRLIKKCVVRLQKTPLIRKNGENFEGVSSTNQSLLPIIDQNKRDNFRKLSLINSSRKSSENKNANISNNKQINNNKRTLITKNLTNQLKTQNGIKQTGKLSLRKPTRLRTRNIVNNVEVTHFNPEQNSIICFEPVKNSTLLEFGFTKDKPNENINQSPEKKATTPSKDKSSSQNLANKSEEIVNLLNSLDEDDEIEDREMENNDENKIEENKTTISKPHKFFNRSKENKETNIVPDKSPVKIQEDTKKLRFLTKRSTVAKKDNIYEFLSQSQTSDSDNATKSSDPTADIIKKLIEQGKVRVATNCKGKGKPVFKRKPPAKPVKNVKQSKQKLKKNQKKTKNIKQNVNKNNNKDNEIVDDDNFLGDHYDNEDFLPDVDYNMESQRPSVIVKKTNHSNRKNEQQGTFSRLARSVLINQTGISDVQRRNPALLLEMVKKYISTPKNKKMPSPHAALESDLSPIAIPPSRPATKASPWRVNEDAFLPRTFNFSRSSGNLPSFSSDFIPATPRKDKSKNNVNILQKTTTIANNQSPTKIIQSSMSSIAIPQSPLHDMAENVSPPKNTINRNEPTAISSFSSNDSNAENITPPKPLSENCNENENIFDLKQLPNPRRMLSYRSPLKAINILEVVHLPPITNVNKIPTNKITTEKSVEMFGFEENLGEDSIQTEQSIVSADVLTQTATDEISKTRPKEDLFGFEDFLSQTELSSHENEESIQNDTNTQNHTIRDKLQKLRKLKPKENEIQFNLSKEKTRNHLRALPLFKDDDADSVQLDGMRQRGIKEMLCSTLINPQPSTSKEALRELHERNLKSSKKPHFGEELDLSELFKDPEPETTFNENDAHRTYIRPYKRKRRLKENKFVMYLDSDESGDENNSGEKGRHHQSHETDTSSEQQAPKKKRHRKEPKENPELNEFVEEFNEMCKEVDSFELVVEKSS
ncbi:dalmatian [Cochliomyia hominivorax]